MFKSLVDFCVARQFGVYVGISYPYPITSAPKEVVEISPQTLTSIGGL